MTAQYSDAEIFRLKQGCAKEPIPFKVVLNFTIVCDECGRDLRSYMTDYQPDQPIKIRAAPCNHCRIRKEEVTG